MFQTMGTVASCRLELPAGLEASTAEGMVRAAYDSVNTVFSTWSNNSEMSRLNRAPADSVVDLSPWFAECLGAADQLRLASGGAFDPTAGPLMRLWGFYRQEGRLPSAAERDSALALLGRWEFRGPAAVVKHAAGVKFDLGAIAKGFAVDRVQLALSAVGVENGLIDLGGNLFCLGGAEGREDWRVGVRDPLDRARYFASVRVSGRAVATSGSYERFVTIDGKRFGHIMNTATGLPATGVLSATVIAPTGMQADGLSTTLFVLGPEKGGLLLAGLKEKVDAVMVVPAEGRARARVLYTTGLAGKLELAEEYGESYALELWEF
jgi:thiamine biosynthesis lipoprotein